MVGSGAGAVGSVGLVSSAGSVKLAGSAGSGRAAIVINGDTVAPGKRTLLHSVSSRLSIDDNEKKYDAVAVDRDGNRYQIKMKNDEVKYFKRNDRVIPASEYGEYGGVITAFEGLRDSTVPPPAPAAPGAPGTSTSYDVAPAVAASPSGVTAPAVAATPAGVTAPAVAAKPTVASKTNVSVDAVTSTAAAAPTPPTPPKAARSVSVSRSSMSSGTASISMDSEPSPAPEAPQPPEKPQKPTVIDNIIADLESRKLIDGKSQLSFSLDDQQMKINDVKVSDEVFQSFRSKYIKNKKDYVKYKHMDGPNGSITSTDVSTN
jgi:hypothetical protein